MMKCPVDFDFLDPAVQSNPLEFFAVLREQAPVYLEPRTGAYFITRAEDLRYVAEHPEIFSNIVDPTVFRACMGLPLAELDPEVAELLRREGWLVPFTILLTDPPIHGRYRRLAMEALSPKAVKQIEPFICTRIDTLLSRFDGGEAVDFLVEFAQRLPLSIILKFLGAGEKHLQNVNDWTDQWFGTLMGQTPREEYLKSVRAICQIQKLVAARIDEVHRQRDDSLLCTLMHAHEATGDEPLTLEETISIFSVLLFAGHDTTRQTLTNAARLLATDKALYPRLREKPELIKAFVEEVIRLYSPANVTPRVAAQATEIGGVKIPANAPIFMCWGSGNRDPRRFAEPDTLQCSRDAAATHLGFGAGIHFCAGSRLARAQLTLTVEALVARYSDISLAVPESELQYAPAINLRALLALPVRCTRG